MNESQFWKDLFVQHNIAQNILEIASLDQGKDLQLPGCGQFNLTVNKASASGENYMSDAYVLKAKLQDGREFNSFTKVLPSHPFLRGTIQLSKVFDREIGAYRELIPTLLSLQKESGINEEDIPILKPVAYYVNLEEVVKDVSDGSGTTLVLENLKTNGYKMADKRVGCDYEHARLTLQALANYHANSIAFVNKYREGNKLREDFPSELAFLSQKTFIADQVAEVAKAIIPMAIGILRVHQQNDAADWIEHTLMPKLASVTKMSESIEECGLLAGVLHGDAWINNIMFQYEGDRVRAAKLVDWQLVRFGHPASDILYFLFTSTTHDVRREHLEQLLKEYYDTLKRGLSLYNVFIEDQGYSYEKFCAEIEQRYVWGMFMGLLLLPNVLDLNPASQLPDIGKDEMKGLGEADSKLLMAKMEENIGERFTIDIILQNELLCKRVMEIVSEVYTHVCK